MRAMAFCSVAVLLLGCKGSPAPKPKAALPPCTSAKIGVFPLYPGAALDASLGGRTVGATGARNRVQVYRVAAGVRQVRRWYQTCLKREPSGESEDGSVHYSHQGVTLTLSGDATSSFVRASVAPKKKP